jgi:hypothetical protein
MDSAADMEPDEIDLMCEVEFLESQKSVRKLLKLSNSNSTISLVLSAMHIEYFCRISVVH